MAGGNPGPSLGTATIRVIANTTEFDYRLRRSLKNLSARAAGVGAALAGLNFLGNSVKEAAKLESVMTRIKTIMDSPAEEGFLNTDKLRELSNEMGIAATSIGESAYLALSSGVKAKDVMEVVAVSAKTALTTGSDVKTVVDATTSALNAFAEEGMTAAKANDILFQAMKLGKGSMRDFSRYISNAIPVTDALGGSLEELSALGAASTLTGKTPRVAFTGLKVAMQELSDATKGGGAVFKQVFGKDFQTYIKNGGSLAEGMVKLGKKVGRGNLTSIFGAKEGAAAIQNLMSLNEKQLSNIVDQVNKAGGSVEREWGKVENTVAVQTAKLKERWRNLKSELGENLLPAANVLARGAQDMLAALQPFFKSLGANLKEAFSSDAMKAALENIKITFNDVVKPVLLDGIEMLKGFKDPLGQMFTALVDMAKAMSDVFGPVIREGMKIVFDTFAVAVPIVTEVIEAAAKVVKVLFDNLTEVGIAIGILTAAAGIASFAMLVGATGSLMGAIGFLVFALKYQLVIAIGIARAAILAKLVPALTILRNSFIFTWLAALGPVGWIIAGIGALIAAFVLLWRNNADFREFWKDMWLEIKAYALTAMDFIVKGFVGLVYGIVWGARQLVNGLSKIPFFGGAFKGAREALDGVMDDMGRLMHKSGEMASEARRAASAFDHTADSAREAARQGYIAMDIAGMRSRASGMQGPGLNGDSLQDIVAQRQREGIERLRNDMKNNPNYVDEIMAEAYALNEPKKKKVDFDDLSGLNDYTGGDDGAAGKAAKKAAESAKKAAARAAKSALEAAKKIITKLTKELGKRSTASISSEFDKLIEKVAASGNKKLLASVKKYRKIALEQAKDRDKISTKLKAQQDKLDALVNAAKAFKQGIRDTVTELGSVTKDNAFVDLLGPDLNKMISNLTNAVEVTTQFKNVFNQLRGMKLNDTMLRQLIDAGPVEGLRAATAILAGGAVAIETLNQGQKSLDVAGKSLAGAAYSQFYAQGIQIAEGLVKGLESQEDKLIAKMNKLGKTMANAFKTTMGIKSPSKVFEAMGAQLPAGLAKGVEGNMGAISNAVNGMGDAASGFSATGAGAGGTMVKVYIGDQELRGIVRTEVGNRDRTTKARVQARGRSGSLYGG